MRSRLSLFLCLGLIFLAGCQPQQSRGAMADGHNAQNALDWAGVYRGTLPCADCPGIDTQLTLNPDRSYVMISTYRERSVAPRESRGVFRWEADGSRIALQGDEQFRYKIGENRLVQLDMDGNEITGPLAAHFILHKQTENTIAERYWKLVELRGKTVSPSANEPHMILKSEGNRVNGSGGCNRFTGQYALQTPDRIRFSGIASTMMACADGMAIEQEFLKTLEMADSYTLDGDHLVLNRARMAPLARFQAVYLY